MGQIQKYLRLAGGGIELMAMPAQAPLIFDNRFSFNALPMRQMIPGGTPQPYGAIIGFGSAHPVNRVGWRTPGAFTASAPLDAVVTAGKHTLMVRVGADASGPQVGIVSLGTTLRDVLSRRLFSGGLPALLDTGSSPACSKRRCRSMPPRRRC
jgi:hypothetical protein